MYLRMISLGASLFLVLVAVPAGSWAQVITVDIGPGICTLTGTSPLNISIEGLSLNTVIGQHYDRDKEDTVPLTLADAIVEAAARRLVGDRDWPDVTTRVRQIRDEEIRTRVAAEIEAALSGTFTTTNQYGEAVGKQTTLREEIARVAQAAVKIDNRNSYSREGTAFENVVRTEVNKALTAELTELVKHEKAKVVAAVQGKAGELIAQAVKDGLR